MNKLYQHTFIGGYIFNKLNTIYINKSSKFISGYVIFGNRNIINLHPNTNYKISIEKKYDYASYMFTFLINDMIYNQDKNISSFKIIVDTYEEDINTINIKTIETKESCPHINDHINIPN